MIDDYEGKMRKACQEISKWGQEYARLNPMANYMSDMKKVIFNGEMLKAGEVPMWKAECHASESEVYKKHLEAVRDVEMDSLTAKAKLEASRANFEALRSLCSLTKTQMNNFQE